MEHARAKFPNLLHFLDSWVVYKEKKGILLVGPYCTPISLNHMNGKNRSMKMGPWGVLIEEEDAVVITWTLVMQECGLSISLQQLFRWMLSR